MKRRAFIELISAGTVGLATGQYRLLEGFGDNVQKVTILHTNDWHSRIEPFPMDGSRNQGLGGASKRAALIGQIRAEEENVLLFDSGDIFQGTPYFNFYSGELEFKLMSEMGYDAATLGNHDFDAGLENLAHQMQHARFDFVCANYSFGDPALKERVLPYRVFKRGKVKIGVFGLGIELQGLVPANLYGNTVYTDPVERANEIAGHLKSAEKCDLVVCLSHLGYRYDHEKVSDVTVARQSRHIDLILGGHTHTFMKEAVYEQNLLGEPVLINQVGWAGILLGRIDVYFEKVSGRNWKKNRTYDIS
jgi:5'-nucleotidase